MTRTKGIQDETMPSSMSGVAKLEHRHNAINDALRKSTQALVMIGFLAPHLRAQDTEPVQKPESPVSVSIFDTTQYLDNTITTQLATKTTIDLGRTKRLWLVGGEQDKSTNSNNTNSYDVGLKLVYGKGNKLSWVRATDYNDSDIASKSSYGADMNLNLFANSKVGLSFLGDVASMDLGTDAARHTNYGAGLNLNFLQNNNLFAIGNSKGFNETETIIVNGKKKSVSIERKKDGVRTGYTYTNYNDHLTAFFVDVQDTRKTMFNTMVGWDNVRFLGSYDPNTKGAYTQTYLTFGMGKLADRTLTSQIMDQFVYAERANLVNGGLLDSDNTKLASTPPIFLGTTQRPNKVGQFIKFSWKATTKDKDGHNDFDMYGVTAFRNGLLITENVTKDTLGNKLYGGGIGYKPWKNKYLPTLVFVAQSKRSYQGAFVYTFRGNK